MIDPVSAPDLPELATCPGCNGLGRTWKGTGWDMMTCPVCEGVGQIEALPPEPPIWAVLLLVAAILAIGFFLMLAVDLLGAQP